MHPQPVGVAASAGMPAKRLSCAARWQAGARLYNALAVAFSYPDTHLQQALIRGEFADTLSAALAQLPRIPALVSAHRSLHYAIAALISGAAPQQLESDYIAWFDASRDAPPVHPYARLYAAQPGNPAILLQHLQGLYREQGLALDTGRGAEQADHLTVQLEFMALLLQRLAQASDEGSPAERLAALQSVRRFQQELVWLPRFVSALEARGAHPFYTPLARLLLALYRVDLCPQT